MHAHDSMDGLNGNLDKKIRRKMDDRILEMMSIEEFKKEDNCYGPLDTESGQQVHTVVNTNDSQLKIL